MVSVNSKILKNCFKLYDNLSIYSEYTKIAFKYHKCFKEYNNKKSSQDTPEKLKEDVKKWFFAQSLESRMKICTVENEHFGKILYQIYYHYKQDKTSVFKPKKEFLEIEGDTNNEEFNINNSKKEDDLNFKNVNNNINNINNNIKITKTYKNGKKTEAPKLGYSQMSLDDFKQEEIIQNNYGNYLAFFSLRSEYTLAINNDKKFIEKSTEDFFKNILYYSVHHRFFPDCFTLSPEILLEKEKFENYFAILGNQKYFYNVIQSCIYNNNNSMGNTNKTQKVYGYKFPDWLSGDKSVEDIQHTVTQYAVAFFEQVIMIKYLLNRHEKKIKYFSLIDEDALNRFFSDRKLAINYMKKNYNQDNKINILTELNIEECYKKLMVNNDKIKYVNYFKRYKNSIGSEKNPYIDSINYNPHSNKYEEQYNKMNKITKQKMINIKNGVNKNINGELTYDEIFEKIKNNLNTEDFIYFIDYLLFDNHFTLWKIEFFIKGEIFEKLSKLIIDKNCNELIFDYSKQQNNKNNKPKHRKKNKKNKKEEEKNNNGNNNNINNNKTKNEYEGIFKDEEEEMYAPYYLKANTEQKKLYLKSKENNDIINNIKNDINKNKEIDDIKNFIAKDIILGLVIDRIFLIPLNNCLDFYEKYKKDEINNTINEKEDIKDNLNKEENSNNNNNINNNIIIKEEQKEKEVNEINDEKNNSDNEDSLTKKSESMTITTQDSNNNININLEIPPSEEKNSDLTLKQKNDNDNESETNNINNDSNSKNNVKQKKKKEKEQNFFLFDTVKKKKKKQNTINNNYNTLVSNEFRIILVKEPHTRLPFFDKLHNDIIKYETKVIALLNHGMKFKDFCITEIKRLIQETLNFSNDYTIEVYGSYATGLMIEASDIDIKIKLNKGTKADLDEFFKKVCEKLESEKKFDEINPIGTASVPVIKLLLSKEKFIKGKSDLENSYKQFKELSLFKHYIFDINELTKIKIDVTFILPTDNNNKIINNINNNDNNNIDNNNSVHDHDKSMGSEISSVSYVKEQIAQYPEIKFILRVLKRYFYYKKMNSSFLGGLSSYNLFLLLLSYAKYLKITQNFEKTNLGYFLYHFLYCFKIFDFKQYIININSENNIYDILPPEKAKEYNFGKSIVIIDPLTGVNASKSSYKIDEIQNTFSEAFDFFQNEQIRYDKEGKTKINKSNNSHNKEIVTGLNINNKNENNHGGGGNIIEKFLGK